eukprot:gene32737-43751_t
MAADFLGCPLSSVPSEQVFSAAGRVLTEQRSNLKPETLEKL